MEGEKERETVGVFDNKKKAPNAHYGAQKETLGVMLHRTLFSSIVKARERDTNRDRDANKGYDVMCDI